MIKIEKNSKGEYPNVWVFSDPHYNHKNICRGVTNWRLADGSIPTKQTRNFQTLEEMNNAIVNNINNVIQQDDIAICLGDWSFGGFEFIREFWDRLNCKNIHLILGNHDHHIKRNKDGCKGLFLSVSEYNTLVYDKHTFKLFHYPISSWDNLNKGVFHLHGHCHLPDDIKFGVGRKMDIGMDGHPEFRPYNLLDECVLMLSERPIRSDIAFDHHTDEMLNKDGKMDMLI